MEHKKLNKDQILNLLGKHKKELKDFGVKRIGLFGSYIKDAQKKGSDIDLLVEFEEGEKNFDNFMGLSFFLEEELFKIRIDLLTPEALSPYIKPHIMENIVYEKV